MKRIALLCRDKTTKLRHYHKFEQWYGNGLDKFEQWYGNGLDKFEQWYGNGLDKFEQWFGNGLDKFDTRNFKPSHAHNSKTRKCPKKYFYGDVL